MESTGVYWINLYLMLEEPGIEPYLANAKHVKNVTGRKKDDTNAIWLQKLHSCGLLQKSFQPEGDIRTLRTYVRQRRKMKGRLGKKGRSSGYGSQACKNNIPDAVNQTTVPKGNHGRGTAEMERPAYKISGKTVKRAEKKLVNEY